MFARLPNVALSVALVVVAANATAATLVPTVVYSQDFPTNTPDLATTLTAYPELFGVGDVKVSGNAAEIVFTGNNDLVTDQAYNEEIWVSIDMGMYAGSPGTTAQGMILGNRAILYFGGNGAFRIHDFNPATGVLGGQISTPTNIFMTYTPAVNQLHKMTVHSDNLGGLDVTITDTLNPGNTWSQSFSFGGFIPGPVGMATFYGAITARFDNWTITAMREVVVPEPATFTLLGLGLAGIFTLRRNRAR